MPSNNQRVPNRVKLLSLIGVLLLAVSTCTILIAQQKAIALKFDVLTIEPNTSYTETQRVIKERTDRFIAAARRQAGKIKYLVYYRARVQNDTDSWNKSAYWANTAKYTIAQDEGDVLVLDAGVRELETLEFWFVPRGELPTVKPEFERSDAIDCPSIIAYQSGVNFDKTRPVELKARAGAAGADSFNWTISDGSIVGKNGWSTVAIDVTHAKGHRLTAFLEVEGLPMPCKNRAIVVAEFGNTPRLRDSFGRASNGDIKARLDGFFADLVNHPDKQGYVFIYGGRNQRLRDAEARKRLIRNQIFFRRFDPGRISIVDAGYREEISTELWLVPPGVDPPKPDPSVDSRFVNSKPISPPARRR